MIARFSSRARLPHFPPYDARGFALLVTITLVAFLVLILVGLASFTRVETSVADNAQSLAQARQNALTALNIAVGELQRAAGPDQRVTATADILSSTDATKNRWTGVWDSTDPTSAPTWLVSRANPNVAPANTGAAPAPDDNNIELVGSGSTDFSTATGNPSNRIVVPAQTITADVPGIGAGSTVGKFAWWVGDEGVKARVNLVDAFAPTGSFTPTPAQQQLRLSAAQRLGIENMRTITADAGTVLGNAFPANQAAVAKLFQLNQVRFLNSGAAALNSAPRRLFHDLTVHSAGVLSDARRGGLRGDFSYLLSQPNLNAFRTELGSYLGRSLSSNFNPIVSDLDGDGTLNDSWTEGPSWEQLWSFYHLGNPTGATPAGVIDNNGRLVPRPQTATQHGIYPIVTQARLFNGLLVRDPDPAVPDDNEIDWLIRPVFVLANPYSTTLAPSTYYITLDFYNQQATSPPNDRVRFGWYVQGDTTYRQNRFIQAAYETLRFEIQSPAIPPGEARVFTLASTPLPHQAGQTYPMANDWDPSAHISYPFPLPTNVNQRVTDALLATGIRSALGGGPTNIAGNGSNFALTLWSRDLVQLQRLEAFGYSGVNYNPSNTQIVNVAGIRTWTGGFGLTRTGPGDDTYLGGLVPPNAENARLLSLNRQNGFHAVNMRAPLITRSRTANAAGSAGFVPPLGYRFIHTSNASFFEGNMILESSFPPERAGWGKRSLGSGASFQATGPGDNPIVNAVLFDTPGLGAPIVSLGQLKHFNAAGHIDTSFLSYGNIPNGFVSDQERGLAIAPAYAIGESRASIFIARNANSDVSGNGVFRDASWLLNRELWDGYFFSALPRTGAFDFNTGLSGNPRLRPFRANLASDQIDVYRDTPRAAAANLLNIGAFNINSTSVEAWRALFSSLNQVPYPGSNIALSGPFARSLRQPAGSASADDGVSEDAWSGYRNLSPTEIDALAVAMVDQVKARGPFRSMSDFVNRRLANDDTGLQGALDAAIEAANLNEGNTAPYFDEPVAPASPVLAAHRPASLLAGAPGWVSQGDLLQALAPGLSARSDTFIIRAYGDVRNPATDITRPEARAWVEAVVQRVPDYVEPAVNTPDQIPASGSNNDRFGRRFEIVSFRWLNPEDI